MSDIYNANLTQTLPAVLRNDEEMKRIGGIVAGELKKNIELADYAIIYARLDELDESVLDILARDFHVDWWNDHADIETKRQLLRDSVRVHKVLGTKHAVELAIRILYPQSRVLEWFEYGGTPFCFKVEITIPGSELGGGYDIRRSTHSYLSGSAHRQLGRYTHRQLREQYHTINKIMSIIKFCNRLTAHLEGIDFIYNRHSLLRHFTHRQLSKYTHKQLREWRMKNEFN